MGWVGPLLVALLVQGGASYLFRSGKSDKACPGIGNGILERIQELERMVATVPTIMSWQQLASALNGMQEVEEIRKYLFLQNPKEECGIRAGQLPGTCQYSKIYENEDMKTYDDYDTLEYLGCERMSLSELWDSRLRNVEVYGNKVLDRVKVKDTNEFQIVSGTTQKLGNESATMHEAEYNMECGRV